MNNKYFIVVKCEYEKSRDRSKYWFQFLDNWDPITEEFTYCYGDDKFKSLMGPQPEKPVYFDTKNEAIKVVDILKAYGIVEEVEFINAPNNEKIKKSTFYICSTNSTKKEKL